MAPKRKSEAVSAAPKYKEGDEVYCLDTSASVRRYYKAKVVRLENPLPASTKKKSKAAKKRESGAAASEGADGSRASTPASSESPSVKHGAPAAKKDKRSAAASTPSTSTSSVAGAGRRAGANAGAAAGPVKKDDPVTGGRSSDATLVSDVELAADYARRQEVRIKMPDGIKKVLVDDWDRVTRQYYLLKMPAGVTAEQIFDDYKQWKTSTAAQNTKTTRQTTSQYIESASGIADYFNAALGNQLLYKFERPQYVDFSFGQRTPLQVYGYVHLLRLFVRLGSMLAHTDWSDKSLATVLTHIHDFIHFVDVNRDKYFNKGKEYEVAPPDYQKRAFST